MATDNVAITPGSGAVVAAEAISGTALALVQRVKIVLGASDVDDGNVASGNKMPISGTVTAVSGTAANFLASVSGTVTATGTVTAVSGTAANLLASVSGTITATGTVTAVSGTAANFLSQVTGTVTAISGTAANLLAQVSGTVTATGTVTVVSGTAANLLAQVSGTITATGTVTAVSGTAANFLSQVSGTVTAISGTAANLLAQVSGTVTVGGTVTSVSGTAANLLAQVSQGTASNLQATVVVTAGTAIIGQAICGQQINVVYNGTASVTPLYASVAFTASGDNTVISGVASKNIYVIAGMVVCSTASNVRFWSTSSAGTAVTGILTMTANEGFHIPYCPVGNFVTQATGQAIVINSSASGTVGGWLTYIAY